MARRHAPPGARHGGRHDSRCITGIVMEIYILRHGIAEEAGAGGADAGRALTEAGREKLGRVLDRARAAGAAPSLILTSPYRRAVETARIAGQMLGCRKIVETGVLVPEGSPEEVW